MSTPDRVVKSKLPAKVVAGAVSIAVLVVAFIIFAIWNTNSGIVDARMRGIVVSKEFIPLDQPENQITLNTDGALSQRTSDGEYIITVEVPQRDGTKKTFNVWLNDKDRFEATNVGDAFDVGPYVVP